MTAENENIEERLAAHPFLQGMEKRHINVLAQSATPARFEENQVILRVGESANGFYLLESGSVALQIWVPKHGPITTDIVHPGEPLGWSWLFPPYVWHFDARAMELTKAICLSGITLRQHCDADLTLNHELFKRISEVMVRRLQHTRAKLIESEEGGV